MLVDLAMVVSVSSVPSLNDRHGDIEEDSLLSDKRIEAPSALLIQSLLDYVVNPFTIFRSW